MSYGNWFDGQPDFDVEVANDLVDSVFRDVKLVTDSNRVDRTKLGEDIAEIMCGKHMVLAEKELSTKSVTQVELVQEYLAGKLPEGHWLFSANTREERLARDKVMAEIWNAASPNQTGVVNRALNSPGQPILCETTVTRHYSSKERADLGELASDRKGRFVTTTEKLVLDYGLDPEIKRFRKAAEKLDKYLGQVGFRQPELRLSLAKVTSSQIPGIIAAIGNANVKAAEAKAIGPGPDTDTE